MSNLFTIESKSNATSTGYICQTFPISRYGEKVAIIDGLCIKQRL